MEKKEIQHLFSLLHVDRVELDHHWNYRNIVSPYYRLYFIEAGEGTISDVSQVVNLEAGGMYLIPSFTLCNLSCDQRLTQYFIQFFEESADGISLFSQHRSIMGIQASEHDIANFKRILKINPNRGINRSDDPAVYEKSAYYKQYRDLNNFQHLSCSMETQGIILQLLSRFLDPYVFKSSSSPQIPSKVLDTISYIQLNLDKPLSVALLADHVNLNPDYFSRVFMQHTGERPIDFIHYKRIERARYLLTSTSMSTYEIALRTGFETMPYFFKIFKRVTTMNPADYRTKFKHSS
ncbi:Helix-turn-helix domain-containing protein [Pedobacter sp. ok626]|uniref:helix-turn-helix domain-containing protein n=1 Tax=Pedobacter sp. ok626 TaxID=1761882 RepID=UPI0008804534|nr:helix-turn-helix domain-containing protein [Pedobacter sp. ok626]SDL65597.1 Helix-turn-helix domain-containing protein [Pedobacter sp. ok626]